MTTNNFLKQQVFALLFAAIIAPLSALADTNAKQATIEFALGTNEVIDHTKLSCPIYNLGGTITGIGTGTITAKGESKSLGVLFLTADDCITPLDPAFTRFSAEGNLTLTAGKDNNIMAHYSVSFVPTNTPPIYKYENFTLQITGGTGSFKGVSGSGTAEGTSNIQTGLGFVEGIINISK
jgi:hypothetical protein